MYVCICNALKDRELAAAAQGEAPTVADVFKKCGSKPQCGKCLSDVATIIDEQRQHDRGGALVAAE